MHRQAVLFPDVVFRFAATDEKTIALTFDDGPDPITPQLLDILADETVPATFYVLGSNVNQFPDIARRIVADGHEIANHSWSHADFIGLTDEEILKNELLPTSQITFDVTGVYPKTMRPPYGNLRDETIPFLDKEGWKIIGWSVDTADWDRTRNSPEEIISRALNDRHPGAIVLMHSGYVMQNTVLALPEIIRGLKAEGYRFARVSELLGL